MGHERRGFGSRSPDAGDPGRRRARPDLGAGRRPADPHEDLLARRRENAAGLRRSGDRRASRRRARRAASRSRAFPAVVTWGGIVSVSGRVQGTGVNGLTVGARAVGVPVQRRLPRGRDRTHGQAPATSASPSRQLIIATRFRAVTRTTVSATSARDPRERARVASASAGRARPAARVRLTGRVQPGLPDGRATLQRRTRSGGWAFVKRKALSGGEHEQLRLQLQGAAAAPRGVLPGQGRPRTTAARTSAGRAARCSSSKRR